jgi:AcrR family transcriptional regulator
MARWEPNGRLRLREAALELYAERGYERTTAAEIAERAGLTERTFFRHFGDKREVLFEGEAALQELLVATVEGSDASQPRAALAQGLQAMAVSLAPRRDDLRRREAIISAHPELRERELIKLASLSGALADALQGRGLDPATARLAGEVSIALFRVAFERWIADADERELIEHVGDALGQLALFA